MTEVEAAWLAGFLEGEGSFMLKKQRKTYGDREVVYTFPRVKVGSTDKDIMDRIAGMWGVNLEFHRRRQEHWKDAWIAAKSGVAAIEIMRQVLPWMGERRTAKIHELIKLWEQSHPEVEVSSAQKE